MADPRPAEVGNDFSRLFPRRLAGSAVGTGGWRLAGADPRNQILSFSITGLEVVTLRVPVTIRPGGRDGIVVDAPIVLLHVASKNYTSDDVAACASWVGGRVRDWQKEWQRPDFTIERLRGNEIHISYLTSCDYRCVFCDKYLHDRQPAESAVPPIVAALKADHAGRKFEKVTIACNEPFKDPQLLDLLDHVERAGAGTVEVITTGLAFQDLSLVHRLRRFERLRVDLPLYGASARTHDLITGHKGSFNKVSAGLRALGAARIPFSIHTIALAQNLAEIDRLAERVFADYGAKLFVRHLRPFSGDRKRYAALMPRYRDVASLKSGNAVLVEFPPCAVPGAPAALTSGAGGAQFARRVRIRRCARCRHRKVCDGIHEMYLATYGKV